MSVEEERATVPTDEQQRRDHRRMALIRAFDERVVAMRLAEEIDGVVHPYVGQEAIAVGVCRHLRDDDGMTSTHRGHGHCIAKGADPRRMMAELLGRRDGYSGGKGGSMHIADFSVGMLGANGIVAAGLPIACGSALAARLRGTDAVTACMFGEGAAGAGPFHESLNVAALWSLPVLFVCENNGWAANSEPGAGLAAASPARLAEGYGIAAEVVDGNDVDAVADAAGRAVARARAGDGPTLLEAVSFRVRAHAYRGGDVPDARDPDVRDAWARRDPVVAHGDRLVAAGILTAADREAIDAAVHEELDEAVRFARASPVPDLDEALADVFAEAVA